MSRAWFATFFFLFFVFLEDKHYRERAETDKKWELSDLKMCHLIVFFCAFLVERHSVETENYGDKQEEWDGKICESYSNPYSNS